MRRPLLILIVLMLATTAGACGGEEDRASAVEAKETNTVTIGDFRYRVTMFRQLNPRIPPDDGIHPGDIPEGKAVLAAFIDVCNHGSDAAAPTDEIHLENAFGDVYRPLDATEENPFAYRAVPVAPGECRPRDASATDEALPGAAVVFEVPYRDLRERPFVLELEGGDGGTSEVQRRIELDL